MTDDQKKIERLEDVLRSLIGYLIPEIGNAGAQRLINRLEAGPGYQNVLRMAAEMRDGVKHEKR